MTQQQILRLPGGLKNTSIDAMLNDIKLREPQLEDVVTKLGDVVYDNEANKLKIGRELFAFTKNAFKQWCNHLGVPAGFMSKSPKDGPASRGVIFNAWRVKNQHKTVTFRLRRNDANRIVRAVLPGKFQAFDAGDVLPLMAEWADKSKMQLQTATDIDSDVIHVRFVDKRCIDIGTLANGNPDIHTFGYHMKFSEVGAVSNIEGLMLLFRQICSNGMIAVHQQKPLMKLPQHKADSDSLPISLTKSFRLYGPQRDHLHNAIIAAQTKMFQSHTATKAVIKGVLERTGAPDSLVVAAFQNYDIEPISSRFGVAQAITATARQLKAADRLALETTAGNYIYRSIEA